MAHRAQPSLENPGISYFGRSVYTSFGLEGVNNGGAVVNREDLLEAFFNWAMDEPTVHLYKVCGYADTSPMVYFRAELNSNIEGTEGVSYRWDFGDGSDFTDPNGSNNAGWVYAAPGDYTVRVEVTDSWGNVVVGELETDTTQCPLYYYYCRNLS